MPCVSPIPRILGAVQAGDPEFEDLIEQAVSFAERAMGLPPDSPHHYTLRTLALHVAAEVDGLLPAMGYSDDHPLVRRAAGVMNAET
jgi:hypothetical protein